MSFPPLAARTKPPEPSAAFRAVLRRYHARAIAIACRRRPSAQPPSLASPCAAALRCARLLLPSVLVPHIALEHRRCAACVATLPPSLPRHTARLARCCRFARSAAAHRHRASHRPDAALSLSHARAPCHRALPPSCRGHRQASPPPQRRHRRLSPAASRPAPIRPPPSPRPINTPPFPILPHPISLSFPLLPHTASAPPPLCRRAAPLPLECRYLAPRCCVVAGKPPLFSFGCRCCSGRQREEEREETERG